MKTRHFIFSALFMILLVAGCTKNSAPMEPGTDYADFVSGGEKAYGDAGGGESPGDPGEHTGAQAGKVTAGEWRDLDNWMFWSDLMQNKVIDENQTESDYTGMSEYWKMFTNNRVAVSVTDATGKAQCGVEVKLMRSGAEIWSAQTDNHGKANLWVSPWQSETGVSAADLKLAAAGVTLESVALTAWEEEPVENTIVVDATDVKALDIAFIVDATGSMGDEISFLKKDLQSIIERVMQQQTDAKIRTAALFYRDEGDEYVTKRNDFTDKLNETINYIGKQSAGGGGDYPEAVHTALAKGLQELSWKETGAQKLAFLLLDAPPHYTDAVVESLQKSIKEYAKQGIRIIPVAASGVDKNTEFFLRFAAILTDGTYVFITNDSGIGGDHIRATVGDYEVELLNDLLTRLIVQYLE